MSFSPYRRRWSHVERSGAVFLLAWAVFGCGNSSFKAPRVDAGLDSPAGWAGGNSGGGSADAEGGATGSPDLPANSGGQAGTMTTTGGASGRDASAEIGSGGVMGTGGLLQTGGIPSQGGQTGTGGLMTTGGRTGAGGTGGVMGKDGGIDGGIDGEIDGGIDGGTSAAALALQPLAKAFCAAARTCCKRDGFYAVALDDCEAKFPSRLQPYPLLDPGTVTIDSVRLAACVSAYEKAATTCAVADVEAACHGLWIGTRTEGQSCGGTVPFGAYDCQVTNGSAACHWKDAESYPSGTGVCVSVPRGKVGDPCGKSCRQNQDCLVDLVGSSAPFPVMCFEEDGVYCAVTENPPVCRSFLAVGDTCNYDFGSCGRGNYCDWNAHACRAAAKLGETCGEVTCVEGTVCTTAGRCIAESLASSDVCVGTPSVP